MDLKPLLKEWRIWVLILSLGISFVLLGPQYVQTDEGDYTIGTNINEGLDLQGGTKALLSVQSNNTTEEMADNIRNILEQRVSAFGLTQTTFRTVRLEEEFLIQAEVATTNRSRLEELISQEGNFEARLPLNVRDNTSFSIDDEYVFTRNDRQVSVDGDTYNPGDQFALDGAQFYYLNNTDRAANLEVVAYNGSDIQTVLTSDSRVTPSGQGASFRFPVVLSSEAASRVTKVAENYPSGAEYIQKLDNSGAAKLGLYVDGSFQSDLFFANTFKTQEVTQPSISGGGNSEAEAREQMEELQAILQSGSLPEPVEVETLSRVSSSLGSQFLSAAFISIVSSLIAVGFLVFLRYGDIKYTVSIVLTGSSEVFILLGTFFSTLITLDLASIAGVIAAVGTGVDDQIIITDESGRDKIRDWKKRLKRAFFVIFTSAASTIGAMMPIVSPSVSNMAIGAAGIGLIGYEIYTKKTKSHHLAIGIFAAAVAAFAYQLSPSSFALQAVKGFAVTTILGVMVGITITRPAYAKVIQQFDE